jgi:hypothetical protein
MNLASALKIKSFATDSGSTDSSSNNFGQSFSDPNTAPLLNIGGQTEQNPATGPGQSVDLSSGISPVTVPGSNFVFNNTWGAGVTAAFQSAVISAEQYLERLFPNACTVNCTFNLQNLNNPNASAENSFSPIHVTYSNFVTALQQHAKTAAGRVAAAALAKLSDPTGGTGVQVSIGEARILGLAAAGTVGGPTDDTVTLNSQYWTAANITSSPGDVMAVMEHELSEGIMGRVGGLGQYGHSWAPWTSFVSRLEDNGITPAEPTGSPPISVLMGRASTLAFSSMGRTRMARMTARTPPTGTSLATPPTPKILLARVAPAWETPARFHRPT